MCLPFLEGAKGQSILLCCESEKTQKKEKEEGKKKGHFFLGLQNLTLWCSCILVVLLYSLEGGAGGDC